MQLRVELMTLHCNIMRKYRLLLHKLHFQLFHSISFQSFYIQNKTDWERKLINLCKYSVWMIVKNVHRRRSSHFLYEVLHFSLHSPDLETSFNNLVRAHDGLKRFTPPFWQRAAFCFCWLEELQVLHNTRTFFNEQL